MSSAERTLSNKNTLAQCTIKFNGSAAPTELMDNLQTVEVHQSLYLPAVAIIRLHNPALKWADSELFKIGTAVTVAMSQERTGLNPPLFSGEITFIEMDAAPQAVPMLAIRAYDRLHRLQRGRKTRTFLQVTESDILERIAAEGSLQADSAIQSEVYEYVLQKNETNLEFLQERARRLGCELVAEGTSLKLRPTQPTLSSASLEWGANLTHFVSRLSSHQQVEQVVVRGWDVGAKQAINGIANQSDFHPRIEEVESGKAQNSAGVFGAATLASIYHPVANTGEAEKLAQAIYDDLTGRLVQVEGQATGEAGLRPGQLVEIKNVGRRLSGRYYLTECVHHYTPKGYTTDFAAGGRQTNSLLELTAGSLSSQPEYVGHPVIGVVTDNKDPEERGRVRVKFPWLPENNNREIESNWARLSSPMAGPDRGFFFLPEVDDEVLVAFEQGDMNRPYILGVLWNGQDAPPKPNSEVIESNRVKERLIRTSSGHTISFDDSPGSPHIVIQDKTGQNLIRIDSATNNITIEAAGDITLKAARSLTLDGGEIKISGQSIRVG